MNEDKMVNQEPISQGNIAQPEHEPEQIETKVAQTHQADTQSPVPTPEPIQPNETAMSQPAISQGLRHSKGIYLTAIIILILSLVALSVYFLQ